MNRPSTSLAARLQSPGPLLRTLRGAAFGAIMAGSFIIVGVLRLLLLIVVDLLRGRHPQLGQPTWHEVRPLVFYVLGFAVAGALVGMLMPWLRRAAALNAAMAVGGMIVMTLIVAADKGLAAADRSDWIMIVILGALFGSAAAFGLRRGMRNASRRGVL